MRVTPVGPHRRDMDRITRTRSIEHQAAGLAKIRSTHGVDLVCETVEHGVCGTDHVEPLQRGVPVQDLLVDLSIGDQSDAGEHELIDHLGGGELDVDAAPRPGTSARWRQGRPSFGKLVTISACRLTWGGLRDLVGQTALIAMMSPSPAKSSGLRVYSRAS